MIFPPEDLIITVTEYENFPHAFYSTRQFKDQKVVERLCSIWGNIKKITKFWVALPTKNQPKCNELTLAKSNLFGFITSLLQDILVKCQTDTLRILFLFENLFSTAKSIMGLIIKQDVLVVSSMRDNFRNLISQRRRTFYR